MSRFTGVTVEEALQKALTTLQATKEEVEITILEEGKKGFLGMGKKDAVIEVLKKEVLQPEVVEKTKEVPTSIPEKKLPEVENVSRETSEELSYQKELTELNQEETLKELSMYLTQITTLLGAPAMVRLERTPEVMIFHLETKKQGLLIGKHGKTLNALQYLTQVFVHRVAAEKLSVVVNVGDYRQRRQAILENLAKRTADKVKQTKRAVFLEPMPAFERKQIHSALSDNPFVSTHSEGEEPYRYLVVEPAKKNIF